MASDSLLLTTTTTTTTTGAETETEKDTTIGHITCTAPLTFGTHSPWLYMPSTKKFDLSRGASQTLTIESDPELHHHSGLILDPAASVLVVVDMQNYFLHPCYRAHAAGLAAIPALLAAIEAARAHGIQIAWLNWGLTQASLEALPPAVTRGFSTALGWHVGLGAAQPASQGGGRALFTRSWNEALATYLRAAGKKTLVFAGVNTDQCVYGTLADAYSRGWDCVLIRDASGTMSGEGAQRMVEEQVGRNMGFVVGSEAFCGGRVEGEV